jgi:hypothetical protein
MILGKYELWPDSAVAHTSTYMHIHTEQFLANHGNCVPGKERLLRARLHGKLRSGESLKAVNICAEPELPVPPLGRQNTYRRFKKFATELLRVEKVKLSL